MKALKEENQISIKDLESTEIGFSLKKLRSGCDDSELQSLAKGIMKKWKQLVKAELSKEAPRSSKRARAEV